MKSKAATVDAYLAEVPEDRRAALVRLRELCREKLVGFEEGMDYGMPVYVRDGKLGVAFASQVGYVALYGMGGIMAGFKEELKGVGAGKGCLRFRSVGKMDFGVIERMLEEKGRS